ncbi:MAG: DUF4956 domain-containing protein [Faecalibacterium sp.]
MSKGEIFQYLTNNLSGYTTEEMILNLGVVMALCLFVFVVYRATTKRVNFYSNFGITIILTGVITSVIMMVIENNFALSLGMVGALSIVRFRSAIKDPVDTSYIFWSVAVGLAAGTGNHVLAVVASAAIGVFIIGFSLLAQQTGKELLIVRGEGVSTAQIAALLKAKKVRYRIKSKTSNQGLREYIVEISCRNSDFLLDEISVLEGVSHVNIVSGVNI